MKMISNFFASKTAPGIALCIAAIMALIAANSPLSEYYAGFKNIPVVFQAGEFVIDKPLLLWINDGLMAIFFLVVGMEIKRELIEGHLSSPSKAILPALAALGGMVAPAIIYAFINWHDPVTVRGWAIPAATDIAFALGIILLFGNLVPNGLKVCLVAIAIIDDLLAVIIIALFYTAHISIYSLILAGIGLMIAALMGRYKVAAVGPYVVVGLFIWACVLKSGVHATLAGAALGLLIPVEAANRKSPLKDMEHALHPWVAFLIIPTFAFANAGISFKGITLETFLEPITLGIMLGLFFGKQVGIMAVTALVYKLKICPLPAGVSWGQFYGMALLTGIGFTMSLFIGTLAFTDISFAMPVRLGVMSGSLLSIIAGISVLLLATKKPRQTSLSADSENISVGCH
ncbi:MAG: Na+/H+ antiporter NhaA [Proteobacteria bacterium]|jgi:NhaA family Na+:H+ antiporter|nr:Na+/H+ antiporter NhaA [Alphaproteobacteria bacterium]NCC04053.1 Na+/H+ antiporter NhaA [Pseudomonadota bacterium]